MKPMPPSDEAKQELFAFYRELEQNPRIKDIYFKANNRPDRKRIIESLGFDPALVQEAVDNLQIKVDDKIFTLAEWLAEKKIDPESLAPVRAVLNALNRVEQSGALGEIVGGYSSYKAALDKIAGGASRLSGDTDSLNVGATGVETEVEDSPESESVMDASSDVADARNEFEQGQSEVDSEVGEVENATSQLGEISSEANDVKASANDLASEPLNATLTSIEQGIQADAINQVYNSLVNESAGIQKELSDLGTNSEILVTQAHGESGNPSGVDVQLSGAKTVEKSEGDIDLVGDIAAATTADIGGDSGIRLTGANIAGELGVSDGEYLSETNKDGSVAGGIKIGDQASAGIQFDPSVSEDPTLIASISEPEINVEGKVNENANESFSDGSMDLDGATKITGTAAADMDINLRNPLQSTLTNDGTSVQIEQDLALYGEKNASESNKYGTVSGSVSLRDKGSINIFENPSDAIKPTVIASTSGLDADIEGDVSESLKEGYSQGPISIDGTTSVDGNAADNIIIDPKDPLKSVVESSYNSADIEQNLALGVDTGINEANKYGSMSGGASLKDQGSVNILENPSDSIKPTVIASTTGLEADIEGNVSESLKEGYSEGPISIDGTTTIDGNAYDSAKIDPMDPLKSDIETADNFAEIGQNLALGVKGGINETNNYGSISGSATLKDDGSIEILENPMDSIKPTLKASTSGPEADIEGDVSESLKEGYDEGPISIDGTTTLDGKADDDVNIDLKDPLKSTILSDRNSLGLEQDLTVDGTVKGDFGDFDLSAMAGVTAEGDVAISNKGFSKGLSLEDIDVGLKADDTNPIEVFKDETVEGIVTVYAEPEAGIDLAIDPNTGKVDITGKSLNPNLSMDIVPS